MSSGNPETRKRILAETMRLMTERRGQDVAISDIAQAAQLSRQAVYLHFNNRTDLLVATVRYADEVYGVDQRLKPFLTAVSGVEGLKAFVDFWGNYIPCIYGLARALLDRRSSDEAAASAWQDRMADMRRGCQLVINRLKQEGTLKPEWGVEEATDLLWSLLDLAVWENLTIRCGKSTDEYVRWMQTVLLQTLVSL